MGECGKIAGQAGQKGKQIVIMDEEGRTEALAVYVNWGIPEFPRYIRKIIAVYPFKEIIVKGVRDGLYSGAYPTQCLCIYLFHLSCQSLLTIWFLSHLPFS
jgi:hypothetical protein